MAGMFYSLKEAAEKLNKTEEQLKELVKQGKLREFRDRSNLLFKVNEIEALVVDEGVPIKVEDLEQASAAPEAAGAEAMTPESPVPQEPAPQPEQTPEPIPQPEQTPEPTPQLEQPQEPAPQPEQPTEPTPQLEQPQEPVEDEALGESSGQGQAPDIGKALEEEILLAPETGVPAAKSGLTEADTALTGEGINVLGETDKDYPVTEDTLAETIGATSTPEATGAAPEASLEEIEEDVNLDTFGSGSGLLDLSLQADDTSLGGILDEIYTTEGEGPEPAEQGTSADMATAADQILSEEDLGAPQPAPEFAAISRPYAEAEPDVQSNTLGMLLFLPFVLLIYTAIVVVAGQRDVMPSILGAIQGIIWYILIAAIIVAGLVAGAAFMLTGDFGKALKKPAKAKKPKKPKKPKKSKKSKSEPAAASE